MRFPLVSLALVSALSATAYAQTFDDDDDDMEPAPPPPAAAADDGPRISVGGARALAGVAGPAVTFGATDALEVDAIVGIAKFSGDMAGPTSSLGIEAGVRWLLASRGPASVSAGVRLGIAHDSGTPSQTRYLVEAPVRLELAVTTWLRMHVEGGFAATHAPGQEIGGGDGSGSTTTDSTTTWRVGANGVAAGAGFSVTF